MLEICVVSMFRDGSQHQIARWVAQVSYLAAHLQNRGLVTAVAVEGDSVDDTTRRLQWALGPCEFDWQVVKKDFGHPRYGSVEDPARMAALSKVLNYSLDCATEAAPGAVTVYVESDLIWDPATVEALARQTEHGFDVVAPMIWAGENFYDVWGFRATNGERFSPFPPYSHALTGARGTGPVRVSSVGSCVAMRPQVASTVRVINENALVGWCQSARDAGFSIFVDPLLSVRHPA